MTNGGKHRLCPKKSYRIVEQEGRLTSRQEVAGEGKHRHTAKPLKTGQQVRCGIIESSRRRGAVNGSSPAREDNL